MTKDDMLNATRYPLHAMCYLSPVTRHSSPATHYPLFPTCYSLPVTRDTLPTHHQSSAISHPLPSPTTRGNGGLKGL